MLHAWWQRHGRQRSRPASSTGVGCRLQVEELEPRALLSAGALDPTFGTGGKVTTDFLGALDATAAAVAVQHDGKVVVAGTSSTGTSGNFALARYNPDGTLDATFGVGGKTSVNFNDIRLMDTASSVALQADGKILVMGGLANPGTNAPRMAASSASPASRRTAVSIPGSAWAAWPQPTSPPTVPPRISSVVLWARCNPTARSSSAHRSTSSHRQPALSWG
jgi:uncharacterized delta-60 repeat protein